MTMIRINKETKGASVKLIMPDPKKFNGLVLMALSSVTVSESEQKKGEGDRADYIGQMIPRIDFNFIEISDKPGTPKVYRHQFSLIPHIPNSDKYQWLFDSMVQTIRHFLEIYISDDKWLDAYDELLVLKLEEGEMEPSKVTAAYKEFFEGVAKVFNGDTKAKLPCIYKTKEDKLIKVWGKLLLYINNAEVNNGNPGFSNYPGDGILEKFIDNVKPSLRIKIEKGEDIIPRSKAAKNTPPSGATIPSSNGDNAGGDDTPDWAKG